VDSQCVWHKKPLLESGTLGTKANTQVILPSKTQSYGDSQDPAEESYPMCTLRHFPNLIEHCIEWGRHIFEGAFTDRVKDLKNYLSNSASFFSELVKSQTTAGQLEVVKEIKSLLDLKKLNSFEELVRFARMRFQYYYHDDIKQLLHIFPEDYVDKEGRAFWSGPKRAPRAIVFSVEEQLHVLYVYSYACLLAHILVIPLVKDVNFVKEVCSRMDIPQFIPKQIAIRVDDTEEEKETPVEADDEVLLAQLMETLKCEMKKFLCV
jgi:ubiquitin-activating enzyme E1